MKTILIILLTVVGLTLEAQEKVKPEIVKDSNKFRKLTPIEEYVIVNKGTEKPFTGEYYNYKSSGSYACKHCGAELYRSSDKFDSGCGWPSFDDEIKGAVLKQPDADGKRTEITCAKCGAHLGHVFIGEHLTQKDIRHCVNSVSLIFIPAETNKKGGQ